MKRLLCVGGACVAAGAAFVPWRHVLGVMNLAYDGLWLSLMCFTSGFIVGYATG